MYRERYDSNTQTEKKIMLFKRTAASPSSSTACHNFSDRTEPEKRSLHSGQFRLNWCHVEWLSNRNNKSAYSDGHSIFFFLLSANTAAGSSPLDGAACPESRRSTWYFTYVSYNNNNNADNIMLRCTAAAVCAWPAGLGTSLLLDVCAKTRGAIVLTTDNTRLLYYHFGPERFDCPPTRRAMRPVVGVPDAFQPAAAVRIIRIERHANKPPVPLLLLTEM